MLSFLCDEGDEVVGLLGGGVPSRVLVHSAAVIVWRVGWYDSGSEDMMTVL